MKHRSLFLVTNVFLAFKAGAFVPPLATIMKANFDGRKPAPTETAFRHQIQSANGESMIVEERIAEIGDKTYIIFRNPSYGDIAGTWSKGTYFFSGDKKISSHSRAFLAFYTATNSDLFRDVLIEDKFLKRDQLTQYKSSFTPQGDPATWDLKENYVVQSQVYFSRTPQGPAIVAIGNEEGKTRRAVFFDKTTFLLSRLEFREGNGEFAWNFRGNKKIAGDGFFPEEMSFTVNNRTVIQSSLVSRQLLKGKAKTQWLDRFSSISKSGLAPNFEEGLRTLLGYR